MMLDSTPRWFAPTDDYMSSVKLFAIMGLVGAFDPVLELVVFDRHKLRDLINPNRAMPASDPQKLLLAAVLVLGISSGGPE
jgi:hypothetical protein